MNKDSSETLLHDVVRNETTDRLRRASFESGLAAIRRRRTVRQMLPCCFILFLFGTTALLVFPRRVNTTVPPVVSLGGQPSATQGAAATANSGKKHPIQRITDEQLLALFPGQTVALVGSPGQQQLLVYAPQHRNQLQ